MAGQGGSGYRPGGNEGQVGGPRGRLTGKNKGAATARGKFFQGDDGQWYDQLGNPVDIPQFDENGQQITPGASPGGLDPEQQIEALKHNQDPERFRAIENPFASRNQREQSSDQAFDANMRLAESFLQNQPGQEDYTINPIARENMGWDPSQQYSYEQDILQGRTDNAGLDAQRAALGQYGDIVGQGGLTAIDRAAMMQSQMQREQELRGNREAIMRNAAEQGRGGGVAQMLMQGQAAQGTANMRALDDARMQAAALGRKDTAIGAMGALGGNVQTAQDALDRFNTMSRQDVQQRNMAQQNRGVDTRYNDEQSNRDYNNSLMNDAERLNKSDAYGARGKYNERRNAAADVMNQRMNYANNQLGKEANVKAEHQQAFTNVVGGATALAGAGLGVAGAVNDAEAAKNGQKRRSGAA